MKEKEDNIRPVILRVGVALALSFAGFLFVHFKRKRPDCSQSSDSMCPSDQFGEADVEGRIRTEKTPISGSEGPILVDKHEDTFRPRVSIDDPVVSTSPNSRNNGEKEGYLFPEFSDVVEEFGPSLNSALVCLKKDLETSRSDFETLQTCRSREKEEYEQEVRYLRATIRDLQEREKDLELQLLEFYGLKERESVLTELQNRLELKNMENKLFTVKMETLKAENCRLKEQLNDQAKIKSELDAANAKIKLLKKMLRSEAEQNKLQILKLRERVVKLQEQEAAGIGSDMNLALEKLKNLEAELEDLKKVNSKLQQENKELARKCESTQVLANSVLEDPEAEALRKVGDQLRRENKELEKKIEQLQEDRCIDVEELVYLRWINACLRYELRNFKPENGKTVARDLSRTLSPESEAKVKQLILEYSNMEGIERGIDLDSDLWSNSHHSDELSVPGKDQDSSKVNFFHKLRRLIRGKEVHFGHHNHGSSAESSSGMSTVTDAASEVPFNKAKSVSPDFYGPAFRQSMDIPRSKSTKLDELKDLEIGRRYSDIGPGFVYEQKWAASAREHSELRKFAEVLKNSEERAQKVHRKTVSLGSFRGVRESNPG